MTPRLRLAAAVLVLASLTACGGSSKGTSTSSPTPSPTPTALTAVQAKAVAAAGILTPADLPGYTSEPQTKDADDEDFDAALATCLGVAEPTYIAEDLGLAFTKGDLEVDSSVDVAPTGDAAKADVTALASDKAIGCFKKQFTKEFSGGGLHVSGFAITPVTVTVVGADAVAAFRMSIDATSEGQPVQLRGVLTLAAVGQAEVSVDAIGTPTASLTVDEATALLTKAVARVAEKAKSA